MVTRHGWVRPDDDARSEGMKKVGTIGWTDLTVPRADRVRRFYEKVVGWTSQPVDMGDHADYVMNAPAGKGGKAETVAGICWNQGVNAGLPPQWLVYVIVERLA